MVRTRSADLLVEVGMELEIGWLPKVVEESRNPKVLAGQPGRLDASADVLRLEVPTGTIDRSLGDVHALGNPHWWLDPWNVRVAAGTIAQRLGELAPADAPYFQQQLASFRARIDEAMFGAPLAAAVGGDALWKMELAGGPAGLRAGLDALRAGGKAAPDVGGWAGRLMPHAGAHVVTYHRSWSYLLARFGMVSTGEIEPKPGIPPAPAHVLEVVAKAKADGVRAILVEPFYGDQAAKLIAAQVGATVLRLPLSSGGDAQSGDWFALMDHVVGSLADALAAGAR
jgi:zinc/manganese transport system substrate-binding protein